MRFPELDTVADPIESFRDLKQKIDALIRLVLDTNGLRSQKKFEASGEEAKQFGPIKPYEGTLFVARIGSRSRLSVAADDKWNPYTQVTQGAPALGDSLEAFAAPVSNVGGPPMVPGILTLNLVRYSPNTLELTVPSNARAHLSHTALDNLMIVECDKLAVIEARLHPLSSKQREVEINNP